MFTKLKAFIAVVALSGTVGANVHAAEITVKKGDTLWDLSKVHNTTVHNLKKWNHLSSDTIHSGEVLTVAPEKHHQVKKGDTLWDIAKKYHVSVTQLMKWNKLVSDRIHPGLKLVIYNGISDKYVSISRTHSIKTSSVVRTAKKSVKAVSTKKAPIKKKAVLKKTAKKKVITVKATAYTALCKGCSGITATGINIKSNPNAKVISVDPKIIPLGSKVYVEGYGYAVAGDTGGAIKGHRIDVFIPSHAKAMSWGKKQVNVTIIN